MKKKSKKNEKKKKEDEEGKRFSSDWSALSGGLAGSGWCETAFGSVWGLLWPTVIF